MNITSQELNDVVFIAIVGTSMVWILSSAVASWVFDLFQERDMKREIRKQEFYDGYKNFVEIMSEEDQS